MVDKDLKMWERESVNVTDPSDCIIMYISFKKQLGDVL